MKHLRDIREGQDPKISQQTLAVAAGLSVLMWLVNGRYDAQLADKYLYVVPGFLVAIGYVATVRARAEEPARPKPAPSGSSEKGVFVRQPPAELVAR